MLDPVKASDGFIYERKTIQQWYAINRTSPFTRQVLEGTFTPLGELSQEIKNYRRRHNISPAHTIGSESLPVSVRPPPPPARRQTSRLPRLSDNGMYVQGHFITVRPRSLSIICTGCLRRIVVQNLRSYPLQQCPCGQIIGEMILRHPRSRADRGPTCLIM